MAEQAKVETEEQKRSKQRSPNYPAYGLVEAARKIKLIHDQEKRSPMAASVAARHVGYSSLNGAARVALSALKKFGLLVDHGDGVAVSEDGAIISVYKEGSPEREQALRRSALKPEMIKKIASKYPGGLPSNDNLLAYLQIQESFTEPAAQTFIKALRETYRVAKLEGSADNEGSEKGEDAFLPQEELPMFEQQRPKSGAQTPPSPPPTSADPKDVPYFRFTLRGATVEFRATGPLSKEHYELIQAHLNALKSEHTVPSPSPRKDDPSPEPSPSPDLSPEKEKVASVSFMITNSQKALLMEKGYSEKEIGAMKPADAHKILELT